MRLDDLGRVVFHFWTPPPLRCAESADVPVCTILKSRATSDGAGLAIRNVMFYPPSSLRQMPHMARTHLRVSDVTAARTLFGFHDDAGNRWAARATCGSRPSPQRRR